MNILATNILKFMFGWLLYSFFMAVRSITEETMLSESSKRIALGDLKQLIMGQRNHFDP